MPTIADRLAAAFSAFSRDNPHSLDDIEALYAPDVVFEDPLQHVEGRDAFHRMNQHILSRCAYVRVEDVIFVGDDDRLMATWTMILKPRLGPEMRIAGASVMELEGGRVVYHRDYWDILGTVMSGFPLVEPIYKKLTALLG